MNTPFYNRQLFSIILFLLVPFAASSQKSFLVEISGGAGTGWWTYNKGIAEDDSGHLGWDHTKTRAFINTGGNLVFKINKWSVGTGAKLSFFLTDEMLGGDHSLTHYDKYPIAEKNVRFTQLYALAEYDLFKGKKFVFSPHVKLGSFLIDTTHPRADYFGFRIFAETGFSNQFVLIKNLFLIARPNLQMMTIWGNKEARDHEKNQIFNLSLDIGLRYAFF